MNNYEEIESKYEKLIKIAKDYMSTITEDKEHDISHMNDVVNYTKKILENIEDDVEPEICIIAAYWHDVGRTKISEGHEELSAKMLKEQMQKMGYDEELIDKCYKAIKFHKWDMKPVTTEGLVIKDADKVAWIGQGRWKSCLESHQRLDSIVELLPKLKNEIFYFDYSKKLYDEEIIKLVKLLYGKIYDDKD